MEEHQNGNIIAEIENRLQFNVFVSIFFCTLLYSFSRSLNKPDVDANKVLTEWAAVPAAYLLSYCVFEAGRSVLNKTVLRVVNVTVLIGAALFVLPMSIIAAVEAHWFRFELLVGVLSFWGIPIIAMALVIPIVVGVLWGMFSKLRSSLPHDVAAPPPVRRPSIPPIKKSPT